MLTFTEMLARLDHTLTETTDLVATAAATDLQQPTPCTDWDLAALFGHMIGQNHGFAEAVAAGDAPVGAYAARTVSPADVEQLWRDSATRLHGAFAASDPEATVHLAEFGFRPAVADALGMQLLDAAVHAWDVATALGTGYRPDDAVVGFTLGLARQVAAAPGGTPAFAAPLTEAGDDPWHDALRLLGRAPQTLPAA